MRVKTRAAFVVGALCAGSLCAGVSPARAADRRQAEARAECAAGRYQRGVALLAELYGETRDANYIYNQGRCFQDNDRPEEAIERFREFLRKTDDLSPREIAEVSGRIAECEHMRVVQVRRAASEKAAAEKTAAKTGGTGGTSSIGDGLAPPEGAPSDSQDRSPQRTLRITSIALGALGLTALSAGVVMGMKARSLEEDVLARFERDQTFSRQSYDDGQRAETLQWVGYTVGVAALGAGAVCYILGTRPRFIPSLASVMVLPDLAPQGAGGLVRVAF